MAGRVALVTGASRGIGRAAAKALADEGAHVICVARTVGGLEDLDDEIQRAGGSATLVPLDLKDFPALDRLGASIHERWGRLDAVLGNAGRPGCVDAAQSPSNPRFSRSSSTSTSPRIGGLSVRSIRCCANPMRAVRFF